MLKKAASLRQGYGRQARAFLACRSGFAQAGRPFAVLTYEEYAPRVKTAAALLDRPFRKTQQGHAIFEHRIQNDPGGPLCNGVDKMF